MRRAALAAQLIAASSAVTAQQAHELGHALQIFAIEGGQSISYMFVEGFATWAAGPYWLD